MVTFTYGYFPTLPVARRLRPRRLTLKPAQPYLTLTLTLTPTLTPISSLVSLTGRTGAQASVR